MRHREHRGWKFAVAGLLLCVTTTGSVAAGPQQQQVQRVPLGGSTTTQQGERYFGVYVPTRYGGNLTVTTTSGEITRLRGPNRQSVLNGSDLGMNSQGWYTFKVEESSSPYRVSVKFVQVGQSRRKPWNFYYWPTKGDVINEPWAGGNGRVDTRFVNGDDVLVATPGSYIAPGEDIVRPGQNGLLETTPAPGDESTWFPNLYDDLTWRGSDGTVYSTPSPLLKYDQLFRSSARSWEARNAQNQDISRWPGHCLGGAVASILLNEPVPSPSSGFTQDELKALWAELGENHLNHQIGDYATDIPVGPPRPGSDATDQYAPRVHRMLEQHIRGQRKALLANMRAFPPNGKPDEVWNQGVGLFRATYFQIPGQGERSIRLVVEIEANTGANLNNQDPKPRKVVYEYTVVYDLNGEIDESKSYKSDWIAVRGDAMYAPLNVLEVTSTRWQGHNPHVTESNIRSIDTANGGGGMNFARSSGSPPQFQPVSTAEIGSSRGAIFDGFGDGVVGNGFGFQNAVPRRGLISRFFGN